MMLSQPSEPARAAEAWERFSAAWPFDPVPYRRAAAEAAFAELTREEREAAIRCARTFVKAWRAGGRSGLPDARNWIRERGWKAFALTLSSAPPAALPAAQSGARLMAARLPDGSYRLHPELAATSALEGARAARVRPGAAWHGEAIRVAAGYRGSGRRLHRESRAAARWR